MIKNLPKSLTTVTPFSKLLAGILFLILITSGFFAGMKYQTVIDLTKYQQANLVTTIPSPTPDQTTNWKIYTNKKYGFELKYPNEWSIVEAQTDENITFSGRGKVENKPPLVSVSIFETSKFKKENIPYSPFDYKIIEKNGYTFLFVANTYLIGENASNETKQQAITVLAQIFSTFKFLDASATPTCIPRPACLDATPRCLIPETSDMCPRATACTMEAKLCPDGKTYVSRQGPNCSFAPCP